MNHYNSTVGTTPVTNTIASGYEITSVFFANTHATNDLLVSFDAGTSWRTIPAGIKEGGDLNITTFKVKGSAAGTTFETLYSSLGK